MQFADPRALLFLLVIPWLVYRNLRDRRRREPTVLYSSLGLLRTVERTTRSMFAFLPVSLKIVALTLLIVALARPQGGRGEEQIVSEGIDIVLVLDVSGSMKSEDFTPKNRLGVAKDVMSDFIRGRTADRLGLVVFAGGAITQCPLTVDHEALIRFLEAAQIGMIEDGTAIGVALATGANRLKDAEGQSRVMVLLTDGVNNRGEVDPLTAARLASSLDIKVYTIGVGRQGTAPYPVDDPFFGKRYIQIDVEIDEEILREIARITGGRYFRATNTEALQVIYDEIDEMEKTVVNKQRHIVYTELYRVFVVTAFGLLALGSVLSASVFRRIP